ncbi:MAG: GntP family permease [Clostridiales bacterium]|nr:GntP family permease [Clostridiales bacterium]
MGPVVALLIGIVIMMFLVIKTKIQAFPALILTALIIGLLSGLPAGEAISAVTTGFGNTMTSIGIVIGLGCIMGKFMEKSGAAKRMALTILKAVGIKSADIVLGLTGFLVSIPVFCDSGFVILSSLAKEFSRLTKKSMVLIGGMLGMGLYITHFLVPPTPGPLAVASTFGVDIGLFILAGLALSIPLFIFAVFFFRWISKKHEDIIPERDEEDLKRLSPEQRAVLDRIKDKLDRGEDLTSADFSEMLKDETLPGAGISFATLLVPVLLILSKTITDLIGVGETAQYIFALIGSPVTAIFISVLMSVYLLSRKHSREDCIGITEAALNDAGLIAFVTAAGGALGNVIKVTEAGTIMAEAIISAKLPIILVPLLVGTILRFPQGSGTVAMITGSAILAPMLPALGINPVIAGLAVCTTAMAPSYLNDSYFWVVTRFSGLPVNTSLKTWSVGTIAVPIVGSIILAIVNIFL